MYDSFPSLSVLSHYFLLFHCCQEKTGVNHYRQYRLKMQSPPGVQGHWGPMGGRKSVNTHTCTCSHLTGAACKQCDCRLFAQQPFYRSPSLPPSLCLVCALLSVFNLTSLCPSLLWPFLSLKLCDVIWIHFTLLVSQLTRAIPPFGLSKTILPTSNHIIPKTHRWPS